MFYYLDACLSADNPKANTLDKTLSKTNSELSKVLSWHHVDFVRVFTLTVASDGHHFGLIVESETD